MTPLVLTVVANFMFPVKTLCVDAITGGHLTQSSCVKGLVILAQVEFHLLSRRASYDGEV